MDKYSYISNAHANFIEEQYKAYKQKADSVDISWQKFFEGFDFAITQFGENSNESKSGVSEKEVAVNDLIDSFRERAHLTSKTNPVRERLDRKALLGLSDLGLTENDLEQEFQAGVKLGLGKTKLKTILKTLVDTYSGVFGYEYMYIRNPEIQNWFKNRVEVEGLNYKPSIETKKRIFQKLNEAVIFENFLHTKYIGQKRFSLEGGESLIPALDRIISSAADQGVVEVIIGMAHRGRLNVLANTLGKTYEEISEQLLAMKANRHIIFYRTLNENYIEITRILHERMDLKKRIAE